MNIQKSRLAAMLTVMLMVCMMVAMLAVPASAATYETVEVLYQPDFMHGLNAGMYLYYTCPDSGTEKENDHYGNFQNGLMESVDVTIPNGSYYDLSNKRLLVKYDVVEFVNSYHNENLPNHAPATTSSCIEYRDITGTLYYGFEAPHLASDFEGCETSTMRMTVAETETTPPVTPTVPVTPDDSSDLGLTDVVTPDLFNMVLDEVVSLLPIVIPVMIGFIGLRKGISFLQSVLHSA